MDWTESLVQDHSIRSNQHWDDYWVGASGESKALNGEGQQEALADYWRMQFECLPNGIDVLDIACGAGAIFSAVENVIASHDGKGNSYFATDFSPSAVEVSSQSHLVLGAVSDARVLPFADDSIDFIVSQFGIEYAGQEAFLESSRILKPGGQMAFVCHYQDGAIFKECEAQAEILAAFGKTNLLRSAHNSIKASIQSARAGDRNPIKSNLESEFKKNAQAALDIIRSAKENTTAQQLVARYFNDLMTLSERRLAYAETDLEDWFLKVEHAIEAYHSRMVSMTSAALSKSDITLISDALSKSDITFTEPAPMIFGSDAPPGAWTLNGRKVLSS